MDIDLAKLRETVLVYRSHDISAHVEREAMALSIGNVAMVSLPGEVLTELGRQIGEEVPFAHTMVVQIANGYHGYVPAVEAFPVGGHETWLCRSGKLVPEAGDTPAAAAADVIEEACQGA